ncbi:DUF4192 domain-containing protein [Streptomyces ficellus]|uniref:DUF4192 domain-containing protein n=1 Tax=Streptomyces ficellus TaxID=1977088 RepID=A0A6I6F5S9_9ACTN|nr:DUF4192 domain-containing protein [Streptomyces ficellus]QGV78104.1 DUF4192 domain-containing protein [Streptomyces ficellus]
MNKHRDTTGPTDDQQQITLRGPAELADALPYMMGYHPTDSIVMVALHGDRGRFGGRVRLGIPRSVREWSPVAEQLAECLVEGCERRGSRPDGIVVFVCQDPAEGETGRQVMERLRPLAQRLRTACGTLDVPVYEALCISDGRFWSYCCPDTRCCPPEGNPLAMPGTSVMAAAAAYAGIQVRGSLREMERPLRPWPHETAGSAGQVRALDAANAALVPRILGLEGRDVVCAETIRRAEELLRRLTESPRIADPVLADAQDDALIGDDEAAAVILGLQDRQTRDRAAEWMEGEEAAPALRLWRALARRCVGAYAEHSAAPLTLAGWVAWSTGDEPAARVALGIALEVDPEYVFARLLHQACNEGLDPESLRRCLREERDARTAAEARAASGAAAGPGTRTRTRGAGARVARTRAAGAGASGSSALRAAGRRTKRGPVRAHPGAMGDNRGSASRAAGPAEVSARARSRAARRGGGRGSRSGR